VRPRRLALPPATVIAVFVLLLAVTVPAGMAIGLPSKSASSAPDTSPVQADPLPLLTPTDPPTPEKTPSAPDPVAPAPAPSPEVEVEIEGFLAWAYLDRTTGATRESANAHETSSTESMIKSWIVADHLRRASADGDAPSNQSLRDARLAIRDSHDGAAERLYRHNGADAVVQRMIKICGLTDTYIPEHGRGWWSRTEMSARDAVRLGECLADGRAAGPEWTDWLLSEMRQVRGLGDFGIRHALPDDQRATIAIKNGWVIRPDGSWHVSCLAVGDTWSMGILTRYPADLGYDQLGHQRGAEICQTLAARYLPGFVN
jgi:hypothetical protein